MPTRRHSLRLLACAAALGTAWPSQGAQQALPPEVLAALGPSAQARGQARMRFFGLHIYDIVLWSPASVSPATWMQQPLALEIRYARALDGSQIAERSLSEMQRQGGFSASQGERWLARMRALFPDVKEGDRITGQFSPGEGARFWVNGRSVGELLDADFAQRFFGIWLSEASSEPTLRGQLFGAGR